VMWFFYKDPDPGYQNSSSRSEIEVILKQKGTHQKVVAKSNPSKSFNRMEVERKTNFLILNIQPVLLPSNWNQPKKTFDLEFALFKS